MQFGEPALSVPGAPPDRVRVALITLATEWRAVQTERTQWDMEKSKLKRRILELEGQVRQHESIRIDLIRRVRLLEHGLARANLTSTASPPSSSSSPAPPLEQDAHLQRRLLLLDEPPDEEEAGGLGGAWNGRQKKKKKKQRHVSVVPKHIRRRASDGMSHAALVAAASNSSLAALLTSGSQFLDLPPDSPPATSTSEASRARRASSSAPRRKYSLTPARQVSAPDPITESRAERHSSAAERMRAKRNKFRTMPNELAAGSSRSAQKKPKPSSAGRRKSRHKSRRKSAVGLGQVDGADDKRFLRKYLAELGLLGDDESVSIPASPRRAVSPKPTSVTSTVSKSPADFSLSPRSSPRARSPRAPPKALKKPSNVSAEPRPGTVDDLVLNLRPKSPAAPSAQSPSSSGKRWKPLLSLSGHLSGVRSVSYHDTEQYILSGGDDGLVKLWNVGPHVLPGGQGLLRKSRKAKAKRHSAIHKSIEPMHTFRAHKTTPLSCVTFDSSSPHHLAYSADVSGQVFVWQLPSALFDPARDPTSTSQLIDPYAQRASASTFCVGRLHGHSDSVWGIEPHPEDSVPLVFTCGSDGKVSVWKSDPEAFAASSETGPRWRTHAQTALSSLDSADRPVCVRVSRVDPTQLLVGYYSGAVGVVDMEQMRVISTMTPKEGSSPGLLHDLAVHPTQNLVVAGCSDAKVRIFDPSSNSMVDVMHTHRDAVSSVSIDSSGAFLASGSHDQSVRVWDLANRAIVQDLPGAQSHRAKNDEAVFCVRYHTSSPTLVSSGADGKIVLYS